MVFGLYDVLYSVGAVFPDMTIGAPGPEALDVRIVVASDGEPFRCFGNVLIEPSGALSEIGRADAVIVCDLYTPFNTRPAGKYRGEIAWLRRMHEQGALVCAVCSGTLLLAEAGLLDGRSATAHWAYRDLFRRSYPKVRLRNELALCLLAEPDGIVTAGGATSWQTSLSIWSCGSVDSGRPWRPRRYS